MCSKCTLSPQVRKYCTTRNIILGCVCLCAVIIIVTVCAVVLSRDHDSLDRLCNISLTQSTVRQLNLSVSDLIQEWSPSTVLTWHICQYLYGSEFTSSVTDLNWGPTLEVKYPKGSANPTGSILGGIHFYAQPSVFPTNEICFSYQIKFDANFTWVKGGKLPGLWMGDTGANGGNHLSEGSSFRVMWRANGSAEAYLYAPPQLPSYSQLPGFQTNNAGSYGDSVWRSEFEFDVDTWTPVRMYAKLNTFDPINSNANNDGIVQLQIGNQTRIYSEMKWIEFPNLISGLMMQSFFGGDSHTWSTPHDTWISMTDFALSHNQSDCD
jgi:hypothetical protein